MREVDQELFDAVEQGNLSRVQECLERGANVDAENNYGKTPLDVAREEEHREIVEYLTFRIAKMLSEQGKYNEAQQTYQEAFDIQEVVLGPDHPDTLTTQNNIAEMLNKQGKYVEASRIFQHVFNKR